MSIKVLNYGGGRQTFAMCLLISQGKIERPDRVLIADTGREAQSTWDFMNQYTRPLLKTVGLEVEVAPHSLATVDLFSKKGEFLLPLFTATGAFTSYCSGEWKARVMDRYWASQGVRTSERWIGFAADEGGRIKTADTPYERRYPLIELMLTKRDCIDLITSNGFPLPPKSACYMCPYRDNAEWRLIRDNYPEQFEDACRIDEEMRDEDELHAVYIHQSRKPLREADLDAPDRREPSRQCGLGFCMT